MLKTALVPGVIRQHFSRNDFGVLSRFFIPGRFIALRIGNSLAAAHDDIEKVSRHS
jgi:hypothetical protein